MILMIREQSRSPTGDLRWPLRLAAILVLSSFTAWTQPVINTVAGSGRTLHGVGGPATAVPLGNPYYLAVDANNNLYVSDRIYNTVAKITPGGILTQFAGSGIFGFSGDGGLATQASFVFALGMTFDGLGNAFIADGENGRVRQVDPAGIINTVAGGNCCANNMGDGGPAIDAWLAITSSATIGPNGNLYIADTYHEVIRKVDGNGIISTVAGQVNASTLNGIGGYAGDGGPATQALLNTPTRVVFDNAGDMFICDNNNSRVRKVTPDGIISTFAGGGIITASNGIPGIPATALSLSGPGRRPKTPVRW